MKALLHAAPAWLVAVLLWSLSRIRPFRELLATGMNESRTLVDVFLRNASELLEPVAVCNILAMKPILETTGKGDAQPSLEKCR
jgi:2-dehydropantoate 2-reductase